MGVQWCRRRITEFQIKYDTLDQTWFIYRSGASAMSRLIVSITLLIIIYNLLVKTPLFIVLVLYFSTKKWFPISWTKLNGGQSTKSRTRGTWLCNFWIKIWTTYEQAYEHCSKKKRRRNAPLIQDGLSAIRPRKEKIQLYVLTNPWAHQIF